MTKRRSTVGELSVGDVYCFPNNLEDVYIFRGWYGPPFYEWSDYKNPDVVFPGGNRSRNTPVWLLTMKKYPQRAR